MPDMADDTETRQALGDWLRAALKKGHKTQTDAAQLLGIGRTDISKAVNGIRGLEYGEVVKIAQWLHQPLPLVGGGVATERQPAHTLPVKGEISEVTAVLQKVGSELMSNKREVQVVIYGDAQPDESAYGYFIRQGPHAGKHAICVDLKEGEILPTGTAVVVEIAGTFGESQAPMIMRVIRKIVRTDVDGVATLTSAGVDKDQPDLADDTAADGAVEIQTSDTVKIVAKILRYCQSWMP